MLGGAFPGRCTLSARTGHEAAPRCQGQAATQMFPGYMSKTEGGPPARGGFSFLHWLCPHCSTPQEGDKTKRRQDGHTVL